MGSARLLTATVAGAALAGLGLVVAGCGSSGSPAAASQTTTAAATTTTSTNGAPAGRGGANAAAFAAYQSCLKAHGVNFPSGFGRGSNGGAFGGRRAGGGFPPTGTGATPPTGTAPTGTRPTGTTPTGTNARRPGGFASGFRATLTAKQRAALQTCQSKLPAGARAGGFGGFRRNGGTGGGVGTTGAFAKYTACLAKHGVKLGTSAAGSTTFAKAQAACRTLLPTPGGASTTTTTG